MTVPPPTDLVDRLVRGAVASRLDRSHALRALRPLAGEITALRERLRVAGITRVLAVTTGATGAAAEALAGGNPRLVVLDGPDPVRLADALAGDLDATVLVVAVPPGSDRAGVDLLIAAVGRAFIDDGVDAAAHTVVVGAPPVAGGAPPVAGGATVVAAPSGLPSAVDAYALVPAGLAGADPLAAVVDADLPTLGADSPGNPAVQLAALLAGAPVVTLAGPGPVEWVAARISGLGGPLPVVVEGPGAPGWPGPLAAGIGADLDGARVTTHGTPAAQLALWERAVALAAHLTPPSTPTVAAPLEPRFVDDDVTAEAGEWLPDCVDTVAGALRALLTPDDEPVTLLAHLDRETDASVAVLRPELARRTGRPVAFGWAPRWRPGAGPGPVCVLSGGPTDDELGERLRADARNTAAELAGHGRRVLHLHLTDRLTGLVTVVRAAADL